MSDFKSIILAAGAGTRMKSKLAKVLHEVLGKSMIEHVIKTAKLSGSKEICVVVGHQAEMVMNNIKDDVEFVMQEEQLGTGHAVMQADDFIEEEGNVLILFGDAPLITSETIMSMIDFHNEQDNSVTVLSAYVDDPTGYGRIVRDCTGKFLKSVEQKDATEDERKIKEVNSGIYCFKAKDLKQSLKLISNNNVQNEYYLPDTLKILMDDDKKVNAIAANDYKEILGVNSKSQLFEATKIMQKMINYKLMDEGVTIIDSDFTYIGADVQIGKESVIYPGTTLMGNTAIGEECTIGPNTKVTDSTIKNNTYIENSVINKSCIGQNCNIGPFAYLRPNSVIGDHVKVGDFVEIKNSNIGNNTKASHLTYIGDADVGENVNFGCGTVVVNYDGTKKHRAVIGDNCFIGCNTNLVSPVIVNSGAYIAAGSTITDEVPENSLAIARARQVNKTKWAKN